MVELINNIIFPSTVLLLMAIGSWYLIEDEVYHRSNDNYIKEINQQ